ncbi:MAG TPA: hypothetical protein VL401_00310, partial [Alphaproteobacteria bacterium]|nr:hypothetical protein [Alphaproteobacteria bacterium]
MINISYKVTKREYFSVFLIRIFKSRFTLWLVLVLFFVDFLPVLQTIQKLSRDLWEIFVITGFIGSLFSTIIEMIIIFVVVFVVVSLYIWRLKIPLISYKFSPKNAILKTENLKSEYGW